MTRARATQVHEEAISHVGTSASSGAEAFLANDCEDPVDLLVQEMPGDSRDVAAGEAGVVADVLTLDEHEKQCEACRKSGYSLGNPRGLAKLTRKTAAQRTMAWWALCLVGKQICIESWAALGLGLPEYARC